MRLLVISWLFVLLPNLAAAELKIINLKHRAAFDLLAPVRELLDAEEKVQAAGRTLVLVADGETLNAAQQLIDLLDRPLRSLLIRFRLAERQPPVGQDPEAAMVIGNHSQRSILSSGSRQFGNKLVNLEQSLRVVEGSGGWLAVGEEIPYQQSWSAFIGKVNGFSEQIAYKTVVAGFWVQPIQVIENTVLVDIEPQISQLASRENQGAPEISFSQLRSRLKIPLGEWYPIGEHLTQSDQVSRDIITWRTRSTNTGQTFYLRIDPDAGFPP